MVTVFTGLNKKCRCLWVLFFALLVLQQVEAQKNLTYYIEQAKTFNPVTKDNKNQSKINLLETERLRAAMTKPQLIFNAGYTLAPILNFDNNKPRIDFNSQGSNNYIGLDLSSTNGGNYQAMFALTLPLWATEKFKPIAEQLLVGNKITENSIELANHDIEKNVADQYIACLTDLKLIDFSVSFLQLIDEQRSIIRKLAEAALAKQSDLTLLNIEYQKQNINLTSYRNNYRRDFLDLNVLCGINDTTIQIIEPIDRALPYSTVLSDTSFIQNSKFTEKYRLDSINALAAQNVFELKYKPQINGYINTGLNGNYIPDLGKRIGWSAGIGMTVYLFDGHQKDINRNKTVLLVQTAATYKETFLTQNTVRKKRIINEIKSLQERQTSLDAQIQEYNKLIAAYKSELVRGQISVLNLVTVLKDLTTLQQDFITIQTQQQLLLNTYNYWKW